VVQLRPSIGDADLDLALEEAARDVHGVGKGSLLVLVGLPDVEHYRRRLVGHEAFGLGRVHLTDLGLGLGQQVSESGHAITSSEKGGSR